MSNMLGASSGQPVATQATRYNGMQVQGSQYGLGLPIVYGQQRLAGTLIWYGDFQSIEHKQSVGKGGGGVSTSYTYSSSFQLALCEGPIAGIPTIWKDSGTTSFSDINGTYSLGSQNQAAWSHLSGSDALQYPYTAWVGCLNLALGSSPNVPNFNFEVAGLLQYAPTASPAIIDAEPSAIVTDLLSSTTHGLSGFAPFLGDLTLYQQYCVANSIFLSLKVDQQTTMNEILTRLLQVTNSNTAWSNGKLIVIPYGDETVTGNGVTYTPPTTVQKYFTDSDYIKPVQVQQKPLSDLYNVVRVEYVNRSNNYNTSVAEAKDQADIDNTFGIRQQEMIQGHAITNATLAQWVAQTILQRVLYIRNTYTFTTTMENVAFEPGDVIALSDSQAGLVNEPVRIKSISEQSDNELQFTCEEFPAGVASGATQSVEPPAGYVPSVNGAPDATQPAVIFRGPQFLVDGKPEVWIGVGGAGANWGGANVLVSLDNVSYTKIGEVPPGCRYGTLTAALATSSTDPDTTNSFGVALDAGGTLSGGTQADADALQTLMLIDQELVAYSSTTLNGDGTYTLGNGYLRRGCYQTGIAAHAIGAPWLRVDDAFYRWEVDPSLVGTTVYIKIQPWNLYGGGLVSEASLTPITYVIGTAEEIPDTPPTPTNLAATGVANGIHLTWTNPNPAAVAITSVERSPDNATWTALGQVQGTSYVDPFTGPATYYYRIRARSGAFIWSAYAASVQATGGSADNVGDGTNQVTLLTTQQSALLTNAATENLFLDPTFSQPTLWAFDQSGPSNVAFNPPTLSVNAPANGSNNVRPTDGRGNVQLVSVNAGDSLYVEVGVNSTSTTPRGQVWIDWYNASKVYQSSASGNFAGGGGVSALSVSVPTGMSFAQIHFANVGGTGGGNVVFQGPKAVRVRSLDTEVANGTTYQRGRRYNMNNNQSSAAWVHVGTLVLNSPGQATFTWHAANGYNTGANQQSILTFTIRSGNNTQAPNLSGISIFVNGHQSPLNASNAPQQIVAYATGGSTSVTNDSWEIYLAAAAFCSGPLEAVVNDANGDSFTFDGSNSSVLPGMAAGTYVWGVGGQYIDPVNGSGLDGVFDGVTYYRMPAANMDGNRRGLIDFSQSGHLNKNLDYVADGGARFSVVNKGGLGGVVEWDTNYRAIVDLSQTAHLNKNLAYIADGGGRYASLNGGAYGINSVDGSNRVNTIGGAVSPLGSIATGASDISIAYSSTPSSITLSWYGPGGPGTSGTINRMDGSQTTVAAGSVTVTGLNASSSFYAAAYYDEIAQGVAFVTGQSGALGSPAILYSSESAVVAWQANLQSRLNLGWVPCATAASGGTGSGGGGGTGGCCLRGSQLIELASGVMREAQELTTGDVLSSPDGPIRITQLRFEPWAEWYRVEFNDGRILEVAPDHRFMDPAGTQIHARDLKLTQVVEARNCYLSVARLELCTDRDIKVGIEVEEPHVYYVDGVLAHNKVYC